MYLSFDRDLRIPKDLYEEFPLSILILNFRSEDENFKS